MYQFIAKIWRDGNGNSYHTVAVYKDNEFIDTAKAYGSEQMYIQTGFEVLQKHGLESKALNFFEWKRHLQPNELLADSSRVATRAELHPILEPTDKNVVYNYQLQAWVEVDNNRISRIDSHGRAIID